MASTETPYVAYLKRLAALASQLPPPGAPDSDGLNFFRSNIMQRPDDLPRKLLGANLQRRRALGAAQRHALDTLGAKPDLLGPLGELRYELAHSRLVARFINPAVEPGLGDHLFCAFLTLIEPGAPKQPDPRRAVIESEKWLPSGRIDVSIDHPDCLIYVEMKIDATAGVDQLQRYGAALDEAKKERRPHLVYLTLPGAAKPPCNNPYVHVTLDKLLLAWLPFAGPGAGAEGYLARYLKSIALLVGCAGAGGFDDWSIAQQAEALRVVESIA